MEVNVGPIVLVGTFAERPTSVPDDGTIYVSEQGIFAYDSLAGVWRASSLPGGTVLPTTTIYLDPVAGNDANPGTITAPVKTLQRAYDLTGQAAISTIQIVGPLLALGALTFAPFTLPKTSKQVILQGAPATSFDGLTHVVQSSTAYDPNTVTFVTVTPTDALVGPISGYFVRYLTGALAGQVFPIERLTGPALELTSRVQPANGDTFVIETATTQMTWSNFFVQELEAQNFRIRNLLLNAPAGGMFFAGVGGAAFEECLIVAAGGVAAGKGIVLQVGTDATGQVFDAEFATMGCFFEDGDLSAASVLSISSTSMGGPSGNINMSQQGGSLGSSLFMLAVRWNGSGSSGGGRGVAAFLSCDVQMQAVSFSCGNIVAGAKSVIQLDQAQGVMREVDVSGIPNTTANCDAINADEGTRLKMTKVIGTSGAAGTPGFGLAAGWGAQVTVQDPNVGTTIKVNTQEVSVGSVGLKTWAQIAGGAAADTTDNVQELCTVH